MFDVRADAAQRPCDAFSIADGVPRRSTRRQPTMRSSIIAVPGDQILSILARLPRGAAVLIQKADGTGSRDGSARSAPAAAIAV